MVYCDPLPDVDMVALRCEKALFHNMILSDFIQSLNWKLHARLAGRVCQVILTMTKTDRTIQAFKLYNCLQEALSFKRMNTLEAVNC